jgi:ComF family protein
MFKNLLGRFIPSRCHACGNTQDFNSLNGWRFPLLCDRCREALRPEPLPEDLAPGFPMLAAYEAEKTLIGLVKAWKYGSDDAAAVPLARAMAERLSTCDWPRPWILVPVPLSPIRGLRRGFNQSGILASEIARSLKLGRPRRLLTRSLTSGRQAGRGRKERKLLAASEFRRRGKIPKDATLIIVDDLCTTGATLMACRSALGHETTLRCAALVAGRVPERGLRFSSGSSLDSGEQR